MKKYIAFALFFCFQAVPSMASVDEDEKEMPTKAYVTIVTDSSRGGYGPFEINEQTTIREFVENVRVAHNLPDSYTKITHLGVQLQHDESFSDFCKRNPDAISGDEFYERFMLQQDADHQ